MTRQTLGQLLRDLEDGRPVVAATDLASGEVRLVHPFEDGAEVDPALLEEAREAAARGQPRTVERAGATLFLQVFDAPVRVVVVGAVHIAQALARMVQLAGYEVLVVDPRRAFATAERFPGIPLAGEWPEEALARAGLGRRTAVVALTHDPKIDEPALAAALRSKAFYVGALGSQKTQAARRERLRQMGFGDADLGRIRGPVGLPIGAVTPGEIAAAILAQIVESLRRPRDAGPAGA